MSKVKQLNWQNRIVEYGQMPANQFLAHPDNARRHPAKQRNALRGSMDTLGWIAPIMVSTSGHVIDGHARIEEALSRDENMLVPYVLLDLAEHEEQQALATFDFITYMAEYDKDNLETLLKGIDTDNADIQALLDEIDNRFIAEPINPYDEWVGMPEFEQDTIKPYRELTVRFESEEAVQEFMNLIKQPFTEKTKYIYHPKQQKENLTKYKVIADEV